MSVTDTAFNRENIREYAYSIDDYKSQLTDTVFSHSPATAIFANRTLGDFGGVQLRGAGHMTQSSGHSVVKRVRLGEHAGAKRGAGPYDTHNVAPDHNTQLGQCNWKFYTHGLSIAQHELRINRGDAAIANFLQEQTQEVMLALVNLIAQDIFASSVGANAINSLGALISNDDSIQGLSGSTYNNWNSRGVSARGTTAASISYASGSFAAQGLPDLRTAYNNASEGMVQPDAHLTSYGSFERYEGVLQPQERFQGAVRTADGSFQTLAFKGKPVLADPNCTDGEWYMVKAGGSDGISMMFLEGADFDFGEPKVSSNQSVLVRSLEATCQLVIGNRRYGQNKLTGITD